ncbi:hypothetical protein FQN52_004577 [Onygenales sp. PD_12]|nr:hypothetical protein FQN52_004577 [Onygenales sp. PD_12]
MDRSMVTVFRASLAGFEQKWLVQTIITKDDGMENRQVEEKRLSEAGAGKSQSPPPPKQAIVNVNFDFGLNFTAWELMRETLRSPRMI